MRCKPISVCFRCRRKGNKKKSLAIYLSLLPCNYSDSSLFIICLSSHYVFFTLHREDLADNNLYVYPPHT